MTEITPPIRGPLTFVEPDTRSLRSTIIQHLRIERRLKKMGYHRVEPVPLGLVTAVILVLIGIFAFAMVLSNP